MLPTFAAAFTGTAIEFFETVAIAYALLRAGYRREAIAGVVAGHVLVFAAAALLLLLPIRAELPVVWLRLVAALLLTATGAYWSWKSWRRLRRHQRPRWVDDPLGKVGVTDAAPAAAFSPFVLLVMTKSSAVEAGEILLVVVPVAAAAKAWPAAIGGMLAAIAVVGLAAIALHGRLKDIPEVKLKLATGLLLLAIGLVWLLEFARSFQF
ncbi:MAG: COG4280 domain-containing protein [Solimonas sp.]